VSNTAPLKKQNIMYQDAYNTFMHFFQSGLISSFMISEDGKLHVMPKESIKLVSFDSIPELLQWFEDNEL